MSDVNEEPTSRTRNFPQQVRTQRLEAFSDGVFAIAITLLVLELSVPESAHQNPLGAFIGQWPSYLAYLVSFSTIGALWLGHTLMTEYLERADAALMRLNLLLLLVVAFLPFPTRLLVEYSHSFEAERVATTIYGLTLLTATSLLSLVWRYALNEHLVRPDAADRELTALTVRLAPGLAGYVILIALGLFQPKLAVVGYLLLAVYFIIPFGQRKWRASAR